MKFFKMVSLALALGTASPAFAGRLQVSPTSFSVPPSTQTASKELWISNTSETPLSAQIRVMGWSQSNYADQWNPTTDVLPSPAMVNVAPHTQQLVRIIVPKPLGTDEKTFRVIVDELPGAQPESTTAQINFLLRYSIPFFVNPDWSTPTLNAVVEQVDGQWVATVHNPTTHTIKATNLYTETNGKQTMLISGLVGYVLPNSKMCWPLPTSVSGPLKVTLNDQAQPSSLGQ